VHGSTVEQTVSSAIEFFVDTLREMGQWWEVAGRYSTLLQRVLDELQSSEQATGERVTLSSVRILANMRRCAFDLGFLISRQPPSAVQRSQLQTEVTPARTPLPNELEYLDLFEFFNMPRLAVPAVGMSNAEGGGLMSDANGVGEGGELQHEGQETAVQELGSQSVTNEFNITNFTVDANSDWLFKPQLRGGEQLMTG
jgi:hypothetical protein